MSRSGTKDGRADSGGGGADCQEGIARQRNKRRKRKPWNPGCTWECAEKELAREQEVGFSAGNPSDADERWER